MEEIIRHKKIERDCGDCSLCCKLPRTDFKEEYQWCKSCDVGKGCNIYSTRPHIPKVMGDIRLVDHIGRTWSYVIRYNPDDNDLAIYNKDRFGNVLKYVKRGDNL